MEVWSIAEPALAVIGFVAMVLVEMRARRAEASRERFADMHLTAVKQLARVASDLKNLDRTVLDLNERVRVIVRSAGTWSSPAHTEAAMVSTGIQRVRDDIEDMQARYESGSRPEQRELGT